MSDNLISSLYLKYKQHRPVTFDQEQFTSFLAFFPVLLMAASDGIVDRDEWRYCQRLASGLVASFRQEEEAEINEVLSREYRKEFMFLLSNLEEWEEDFLQALEEYFIQNPYAKKFVAQTVYLFADASDGISEDEVDTMDFLCIRLKLSKDDFQPFGLLKG